jgi:hypothetical protein
MSEMKAFILIIGVVLASGPALAEHVPIGERDSLEVEIVVPTGWRLIRHPRDDSWNSHRGVVFAINNRNDDSLCVTVLRRELRGGGHSYIFGPEAFEEHLKPGTVYVDLAYGVGGPPPMSVPYAFTLEEQPAVAIQEAIRKPDKEWTTKNVVIHRVSFAHWGRSWDAIVAARKPFAKQDLAAALSVLESLRFSDLPVNDPRQAAEIAITALPTEFRNQFKEDPICQCCRLYDVVTIPTETGYHVTFNLMETQTRRLLRSMSVDVSRGGRAALR